MRIRGLIFDLDGTLGNTLPVCIEAFRRTFREFLGRDYTAAQIRAMFGPTEEGILRQLVPDRWPEVFDWFLREYEVLHDACSESFAGLPELLRRLRQEGVRLAVVTGKGRETAEISMERLGLAGYFEALEAGSAERGVKPECLRRVLARWDLEQRTVAYVGDAPYDVRSAREVGVVAVAVTWATTTDEAALRELAPDHLFDSVPAFGAWTERATR